MGLRLHATDALGGEGATGTWKSLEDSVSEAFKPDNLPSVEGRCKGLGAWHDGLGQLADGLQAGKPRRGQPRVPAHQQSCSDPADVSPTGFGVRSHRLAMPVLEQRSDSHASG